MLRCALMQGLRAAQGAAGRGAAAGGAARLLSDAVAAAPGAAGFRELLRRQDSAASLSGALLRRRFSSGQGGSLQEVAQRLRGSAAAPVAAVKSAAGALAGVPGTAYKRLPQVARRWVDAVQPGSLPGSLQRVAALQVEAFWERHGRKVVLLACGVAVYAAWKVMYKTTALFINLSETMAATGFMALAAAMVSFAYLWLRRKWRVDPAAVYRLAMVRLNTHPGLLEVMGAPLAGSEVRAYVLTGGRLKLKGLRPKMRSSRIQMIFPLRGSDRRGLVSLESKKQRGAYVFKLLAVDVPSASGGEQRIFLEGGPAIYERGGVLDVLREPFIRALSLSEVWEAEDDADDVRAAATHAQAEAAARGAAASAGGSSVAGSQQQGMYFYERAYLALRKWAAGASGAVK